MSQDGTQIEKVLDELSLGLVMVDPGDLMALGEVLEKVENLAEAFSADSSPESTLVLDGLKRAVEAIILERVTDKGRTMELVGKGVGLLQQIIRGLGSQFGGDLAAYLSGLKTEANIDLKPTQLAGAVAADSVPEVAAAPEAEEETAVYDVGQDQDLFFGFVAESMEHIESIEVNIITLEQDPTDKETINSVFRPFHTIKGVSGFLNLRQIHSLTHDVENLLDDARNDRLPVTPAIIDIVLDAVDILKRMITDVKVSVETGEAVDAEYGVPEFVDRLHAVQQGEVVPAEVEPVLSPYGGMKLGEILIDQNLLTEEELDRILTSQEEARLRRLGEIVVEKGIITPQDLEEALSLQMESGGKRLGEILVETGKANPDTISQAVREQENLRDQHLGEMLIKEKQTEARDVTSALREQRKGPETGGSTAVRTVKVDTDKLDALVDMVGELVIAQSLVNSNDKVLGLRDQKLTRDLSHMARITSELQRTAMSMRMVPIAQTFQKMIRLVRDLCRKSGKQVDLTMNGEDTEIDRNMVEAIYDPLVHMVRNSVDHGVELPADRLEKGKTAEGRIVLRAFHQGGNVVIEIIDDGQGLNRDRIMAKAIERGLVGPDDNLTDTAVYNLIFQPGFSTADKITDVSGRGVGMDVVKRAIEKLRGKVEVNSVLGRGSTITIRLPLTLAIIDGMIVRVGDHRYILPTVSIHESFRPGPGDYHTVKGQGEMIQVRQNLLPLVRLDSILGARGSVTDPAQALVIVVENDGERRCIMVDEVLGKQEVVIKSLGERLKYVRALAGGSILGDGRVGLILDVAGMFQVSDGSSGGIPRSTPAAAAVDFEMEEDWGMGPT